MNYWKNIIDLVRNKRLLRPLNVTYYLTTQCNLNCIYCEDFGGRRNNDALPPLSFESSKKIIEVIRTGCDHIILTGGEPLLVPHFEQLLSCAKNDLRYKHITVLTNASLLHNYEPILAYIDRLVVSLDSTDPIFWSKITGTSPQINQQILDNLVNFSLRQKELQYHLVANCVITPSSIQDVYSAIEFCENNRISISFSPQSVNNLPHYDLVTSDAYQSLVDHIIDRKKHGSPILASFRYLHLIKDFFLYSCYPMLVPRVWADGSLLYPCRPIEKANSLHGGKACNLLEINHWRQAIEIAENSYGSPPKLCSSCFQQCYAEPSLMQAYPFSYLIERLRFPTCRENDLASHAPG